MFVSGLCFFCFTQRRDDNDGTKVFGLKCLHFLCAFVVFVSLCETDLPLV